MAAGRRPKRPFRAAGSPSTVWSRRLPDGLGLRLPQGQPRDKQGWSETRAHQRSNTLGPIGEQDRWRRRVAGGLGHVGSANEPHTPADEADGVRLLEGAVEPGRVRTGEDQRESVTVLSHPIEPAAEVAAVGPVAGADPGMTYLVVRVNVASGMPDRGVPAATMFGVQCSGSSGSVTEEASFEAGYDQGPDLDPSYSDNGLTWTDGAAHLWVGVWQVPESLDPSSVVCAVATQDDGIRSLKADEPQLY